MFRVDAHHHLWHYSAAEYDWLEGDLAPLRRDFMPDDLAKDAGLANVDGAIAVQARQTVAETDWLLQLAAANPMLLGAVGWLPLREPDLPALLEIYREQEWLKGLRHVVQSEPAGFMDDASFNAGISAMRDTSLVYDILIFDRQMQEAIRLVDRHPHQAFVLDHMGKPGIAAGMLQPWADAVRELARRPNVVCKVSGMVTEADPHHWSPDQLKPYFDTVLEAFTPARLMAGTDWPVLLAGCSYQRWWEILSRWIWKLSPDEQTDILGGTAMRTYRLTVPVSGQQQTMEVPAR